LRQLARCLVERFCRTTSTALFVVSEKAGGALAADLDGTPNAR
jgi:hypothetical protein